MTDEISRIRSLSPEAERAPGHSLLQKSLLQNEPGGAGTAPVSFAQPLRQQAEYWQEPLAGAPEPLELPADRPRPAQPDHAGAFVRLELDAELVAALKALATRHGVHISPALLAGWAAVLGRLSGQTDLVIGCFENRLPVRVDLSGSPTAAELVGRVEARVRGALRNGDLPFGRVAELVQPDGAAPSATPLFRAAFAWRDAPASGAEPRSTAGLDLSLELWEEGGGVAGEVVFATALFERETVERYTGYLRRMLAGMAADETRPVDRLALLPAEERRRVTEEWNRTEAPYPESFIHERFEAQAGRTPDAVAVVYEDRELTYAELNQRANRLAHHLRSLGVGPDVRVGICVDRVPELVVAVLGVLKSGGAYLPLDPGYPRERLLDMVQDSAPVVVLTHGAVASRLAGLELPLLALDEDAAWWEGQPESNPERGALAPENLTYVIYTSGSTGRPKGVEMTHRGAQNLLHWYLGATRITARDSVLVVTSFSFHLTQRNLLAPLFVGGQVHLAREPFEPGRIADQIVASGITMMNLTPTGFQALVEADGGRAIGGLRIVVFGGEPLYPRQLARVPEPRPTFLNPYGATEATGITAHHFARAELASYSSRSMPPGRPIANAQIYVLDTAGEPVPVGVTGELYLGGAGVTRGYRRLPAQTADRFLPDPFGATPGARLYRTGDLGRWLPDGTIEFMGRGDAQVKVRGFRIELGEIEARLAEHAAVREVVVVARDGEVGDPRLVAYHTGDEVGTAALRAHLAERLPEYMIPAAFVHLDALPVNPNGKLDRKALPAPEFASAEETYVAPRTPVEEVLAGIWAEVLGVERVGVHDEFFGMGGHSLLATRVVSRVREVFGVELPLRALFEGPRVAEMAGRVEEMRRAGLPVLPPVAPVGRAGNLPLSFAQQRLWFLEQLGNLGSTYHIPMRLRLRGGLDRGALVRSLDRVVARHEALRTTFATVDGEPVQHIAPVEESGFRLVEHDLRALADAEDELRRLVHDEASAPFDLEQGPLVRGRLVRMAADDHALLLTMHHIVSDGWSIGVLHRELGALYAAFARGEPDPLPPLPVQYADYAAWHRRWVEGPVLEAQAEYWTETLAGAPELLELPADHPRPARQDFAGASLKVELDEALTAALKTLGQRHGATLHMTLLAGWAAVLARLSGQDDVVIGTPSANRGRSEIEGLIGFFVNTLPVRVDLSGAPTVAEALGRVKARALEAQANQDIPFEQVVERVRPTRSLAHTPLFQVTFAWQNAPGGSLELPGLALDPAGPGGSSLQGSAKFDLSLVLWEEDGRIRGAVEYATALFARETVERWLGHLRRVLQEMAGNDALPVDRLDLLSAAERRMVVEEWNATDAAYPREACVHELFAAQVERTPGAEAVVWEDQALSYAALDHAANRLANHLRRRGVRPETRVGICLERGPELVVAILAVLKAGGAWVPLDPAYPAERLAFMLADSGAPLLLTRLPLPEGLMPHAAEVVCLDAGRERIAAESARAPAIDVSPDQLAYVIYTSGSTGTPKGVMVPHRGVPNLAYAQARRFRIDGTSRVLQFASFSFDAAVAELFDALLAGATLVMASREALLPGPGLLETLRRGRVTVATLPPSVLATLPPDDLPELRTVVSAGEAVDAATVERWSAGRAFVNAYGPTETTVCATSAACEADGRVPAIGRPLENVRVYVLDAVGRPAPAGVPGELYVGGVGVARGYLGRPGLTAERFVPDPFGGETGARLYRTGDRARWRADGTLEYLGRLDEQVKVRGFRIEPGEIEARLAEHAGVREAVVLVREDAPGEKRLVAYVAGDETATADVLRAHLSERLPEYMVPAAYVRLETLPLTPNGKVDRGALPAPEGDAFPARGYEAPSGKAEEAVAAIWAELLGAGRVGRRDHFFERGGHSLLAVRVVSRVRQALGVEAAPRDLFERPVLADFARGLETAARAEATAIAPVERSGPLALSFAQQRLWFLEQLGNLGSTYHIPMRLRLRGGLDRGALVRSLDRIVARHEALRTTFATVDGEPVQHTAPVEESGFRLVEHDLRALAEREDELRRLVHDEASAPFDLARGPLFRGRLVRMAADDNVLLLTMHHIVSDGWSVGVLFRELGALYAAFARGEPDPLPPLPVQYADYAAWHRRWVEGPVLEAQAEYWTETLAGAPELLELPTDHPRPAKQDFTGASVNVELGEALAAALKTLSQRHGITLFMTLLAGWATVLSRLSGQDDVVVGTPTANRGRSEIEGLIGFFVNTLPVRVDLSGAPTVAEALGRVKARALEAQANQDIPFEQVVELAQPVRSLSHTPLFQVMFGWQNAPGGSLELPGLALGPLDPAGSGGRPSQVSAKVDLSLALWEEGGRIAGEVTYATALFDRPTVERYVGYLRRALEGMVADDAKPVGRLELLSAAERRTVVEEWNATGAAFPAGACVHELFEAQVARTPGAEAVSFQGERLTYAELNARANRLAHHLRALGVGPEVRVAVCVERGLETVIALLAVLKAGGGYVPLDPTNPGDRLRFAMEDSAPAALLTRAPLAARFAGAGVPVVDLGDGAAWDAHPASNPDRAAVGPDQLAYVIYTSGSTGRPKGVLVRHGSLVSLLSVTRAAFGVGPGDMMPALASSAFDISLFETLLPLVSGAAVRIVARERVLDTRSLVGEFADATLLHAVPALMREIAQVERHEPSLARLRGTFVGGDQVPADLLAEMSAAFPAARTHILYGPTEATILASAHAVPVDGVVAGHPIGQPLGNVRLYVCDASGEPQPAGVAGELLIGGMGVARGYLGRPALTAERFVPDPFSAVPGARLYRSGDRARWKEVRECESAKVRECESAKVRNSGEGDDSREADSALALSHSRTFALEFLGRTDFQVKIRGFRIELGEIEARLREHPAVRQAVVLAREDAPGVKRLVAYFVGEATADALRAHLEACLPVYMVPAAYMRLDALPLTSNGKLDRKALPVPDGAAYARRGKEPPRTMTEQVLAEIWSELLGVERVGRRDNFFDLGGHSLLAVRLVSRVRETLNPAATVEEVFAHPVLYELAARLQGDGEWFGTNHAIPVRETGSERPLFLLHDAVGIVFYGQILRPHLDPEVPVYALPGPLKDTDELGSMGDLVTRLLRMVTEVQPEGPYRLAGWSAGGVFAYAMAERLVATGRAVEFVGLLDTHHPSTLADWDFPRKRQFTVLDRLGRDSGVPPATPEALQALKEDTEGMDMPAFIAACKARGLLPETVTVARAELMDNRIALLKRSHAEFVPGPLPVPVHLFTTDDAARDPRLGWEDMPGGAPFRLVRVPGNHHTMWKKGNVEVTGAVISRAVRASAAGGG